MKFIAQVKEVKVREAPSGDKETRIILVTEELTAAELMKYVGEEVVSVEVKNG
jgi:signal transduction protein with GAF and PtsI domain